ncbi:NAD-dependent epimerase/dehydratase family protein [Lutimonas sp.]|uniref:NAD-dependent epimerase/dehydratase family protein n=1 Tax=Lutimonas sp. TaxID=1872403 RepID=UPI003D9AE76E
MLKSRRKFLKKSSIGLLSIPLLSAGLLSFVPKASKPLKILILGGTSFLGPHQIAYAIQRGHQITTFTRGKSKPTVHLDLMDKVDQLIGDRDSDLSALEKGEWDVVIDNSGRKTAWTEESANLLKERAGIYMYTSSTGVFYPYLQDSVDEEFPVRLTAPDQIENEEEKMEYWYGAMKASSEAATIKAFGKDRAVIVRPTYMFGPGDKTNRFIYWAIRFKRGGNVMVPGKTEDRVQYIDVRDVAEWMIRLAEQKTAGTFNASGPAKTQTMIKFAKEAKNSFDVDTKLVQIDDYEFLKKQHVPHLIPWIMPVGKNYGSARIENKKAIGAGMTFRDLKTSIRETQEWWISETVSQSRRDKFELKPGSVLQREKDILASWAAYNK